MVLSKSLGALCCPLHRYVARIGRHQTLVFFIGVCQYVNERYCLSTPQTYGGLLGTSKFIRLNTLVCRPVTVNYR